MEVVGAALGVADVAARSAHVLWQLCAAWHDAPREVFQLRDDISRASEFYDGLKNDVAKYSTMAPAAPPPTVKLPLPSLGVSSHAAASEMSKQEPAAAPKTGEWPPGSPQLQGKLGILLELIRGGGKLVLEIDSVIAPLLEAEPDTHTRLRDMAGVALGKKRKMLWLIKAERMRKLRYELSNNLSTVSGILVALNAYTTSQLVESVTDLSRQSEFHHMDLSRTILLTTGQLMVAVDALREENQQRKAIQDDGLVDPFHWGHLAQLDRGGGIPTKASVGWTRSALAGFQSCDGNCLCECHIDGTKGPWMLSPLHTSLGYLNVMSMKPRMCNRKRCSQYGKGRWCFIAYRMPQWCLPIAVQLFLSWTLQRGFEFNLRVCRQYDSDAYHDGTSIFSHIAQKDLDGVRKILEQQPYAVTDLLSQNTPLFVAVMYNFPDAALLCLQAGAELFPKEARCGTPFKAIFTKWLSGDPSGRRLMESEPVQRRYFDYLDLAGYSDLDRVILGAQCLDVQAALRIPRLRAQAGPSTLKLAITKGDVGWVAALLDDVGLSPDGPSRAPFLVLAALWAPPAVLRLLLERGADVDARDGMGCTALYWAPRSRGDTGGGGGGGRRCMDTTATMVRLLLDFGASADTADVNGFTSLLSCCGRHNGTPETARCLIRRGGADMDVRVGRSYHSNVPSNAITETILYDNPALLEVLLEEGADHAFVLGDGRGILHQLAASGSAEAIRVVRRANLGVLDARLPDNAGDTAEILLECRESLTEEIRAEFMGLLQEVVAIPLPGEMGDGDGEYFYDASEF